jgi:hypothetical protein
MRRSRSVKARIVAIGNSQGVRIPEPLLEHAGLGGEVGLLETPTPAFDIEEWEWR